MKWNEYELLDKERFPVVSKQIPIKHYGIAKVVVVRTKGNGGL